MPNESMKKDTLKQAVHFIDNWLDFQSYIQEIPGIAVGIFSEDEVIFQKEYGYANLETRTKLLDRHLFRIASHSKMFTATSIMKLYHEGKISLDDRVCKHLPWFVSEADQNLRHITVRHLLTHSSGMTRDGNTGHWSRFQFPELDAIVEQTNTGISFYKTSETLKYSNFGYTLLGQIIEKTTGQTFHEYVHENILEPLNMTQTVTDVNDENSANHATGYKMKHPGKRRQSCEHIQARVMHAATGLSSNVTDLIKFYHGHMFGNDQLFPDYIKREMQRVQFQSKEATWGLGFEMDIISGMNSTGHGGSYPGFRTHSGLFQKEKLIIVVLTNAVNGPAHLLYTGMAKLLKLVGEDKGKFEGKGTGPEPDFSDIIGCYEHDYGIILFSQIGSKLVAAPPMESDPAEMLAIYATKSEDVFTEPRNYPFDSPGEDIHFEGDGVGDRVYVDSHGGRSTRFKLKP